MERGNREVNRCDGGFSAGSGRFIGVLCLSLILFLAGCAAGRERAPSVDRGRLDVLTDFTLALSKRDFPAAAAMLTPEDRTRLVGESGEVLPEYQERLRAMRLSTLVNNPAIRVGQGRIGGCAAPPRHCSIPCGSGTGIRRWDS